MIHLLISLLVGIIAYVLAGMFTVPRVAVIIGILVGIVWYVSGGWGM